MQSVVHIIQKGGFAPGYIRYMRENFGMITHYFILYGEYFEESHRIQEKIETLYSISSGIELLYNRNIYHILMKCDKIIISGLWGIEKIFFLYPPRIWNKVYLQCWGGDFYSYRGKPTTIKGKMGRWLKKWVKKRAYQKCRAILTLIDEDYDELKKVFPVQTPHITVPMPGDPSKNNIISEISEKHFNDNKARKIILGNSATKENCHKEIIDILAKFRDEDIIVYCLLSYGNAKYREEVIQYGRENLNEKFIPLITFQKYEEYAEFLSSCPIGIYNNNRQQAMGNITLMALLGNKIFLREGTAMWKHFLRLGMKLHTIEELKETTYEELWNISDDERLRNRQAIQKYSQETVKRQWEYFLCGE